jgi:hypothetical protein
LIESEFFNIKGGREPVIGLPPITTRDILTNFSSLERILINNSSLRE